MTLGQLDFLLAGALFGGRFRLVSNIQEMAFRI